ncbi:MAG: DUF2339 domain-containing protein [Fimbriimonas sp.]
MATPTIEQLLERVVGVEARLAALEAGQSAMTMPTPPPYPVPPVNARTAVARTRPTYAPPAYAPPAPGGSPAEADDAEYFLGAQVLPRAGAILLILGIGYLVSLAVSNGWLGPQALFGLAVTICLAFIGVGQWRREEREQFGQVLTGIGTGGLYVTFAAGHVVQHLFSGETLVVLFLGLSLANLFYSLWRASPAFLAIGVIGGFAASVMPLQNRAFPIATVLHATILLVAAAIAGRHRWTGWSLTIAALGMFVALPIAFNWPSSGPYGEFLICLSASVAVASLGRMRDTEDQSLLTAGAGILVCLASLQSFLLWRGLVGTYHVVGVASGLAALAFLTTKRPNVRAGIALAAALAAFVIAPIGLAPHAMLMTYASLAVVSAAVAVKAGRAVVALGVVTLVAGGVRYLALLVKEPLPFPIEVAFLSVSALAAVGLGWAARDRDAEAAGIGVAVMTGSYLLFQTLTRPLQVAINEAITVTLIVGSLLFLGLGFARNHFSLRYMSFFGLFCTVAKVLIVDLATLAPVIRVLMLMALGLVLVASGYGYIWHRRVQERRQAREGERAV